VNHVVLHVYIQQPWSDRRPGINAPWGTEFNRHNTWFERGKAWVDYERRACWMLQQGWRVADALYFIGEDTPKMTGVRQPDLPAGYDFDYLNADVLLRSLRLRQGHLELPHGPRYRVLILPPQKTMRPETLRKIRDLIRDGATVVGPAPDRSPSLQGFPRNDAQVRQLAREIWGDSPAAAGERAVGKGRIVWGRGLPEVFAAAQLPPDAEFQKTGPGTRLLFTHRQSPEADIYFVTNQKDQPAAAECVFRVSGRRPELWDAVTGERRELTDWSVHAGRTHIPLEFAPHQSWFVVFRQSGSLPRDRQPNFPAFTTLADLSKHWEVTFEEAPAAPKSVAFPQLTDWVQHADPAIRFYSGKATYQKRFVLPAGAPQRVFLNLGQVRDLATVRLNGKELATLWIAPWRVELTRALKPGENTLEVEIINPWNNRLAGDAALPADQRTTFLALPTVTKDSPLLPAGLLGPVLLERTSDPN
jgi:hypothetical protein